MWRRASLRRLPHLVQPSLRRHGCRSITGPSSPELVAEAPAAALTATEQPTAFAAELGYLPPDLALRAVDAVHEALDLPWWAAIAGSTIAVRVALLPLALHGTRQQSKMQGLRAEIAPLQARIHSSGGTDHQAAQEMQALYAKHNISPMNLLALPLLQLPVFMSFFLGLRRLTESFPDAHAGGAYWFLDLGARDESFWLPAMSGLSALALVRLSVPGATAGMNSTEAEQAEFMKKVLSGVTLISLPVASTMPASVLVFWIANNCFSLGYTTSILLPPTRAILGLPPRPGPYVPDAAAALPGSAVSSAPHDKATVQRAQLSTAETLEELARKFAEGGKLAEAVSMQRRALLLLDELQQPAAQGEPRSSHDRDAMWKLAELEAKSGLYEDATASVKRWREAGGDPETAAARIQELTESMEHSEHE